MVAKVNFRVKCNGHWIQTWQLKNGGLPLDITGYEFEMEIKKVRGAAVGDNRIMQLALGTGITIVDAALGKLKVEIAPQPLVTKSATYVYDFISRVGGKTSVLFEGQIIFEPGVSYTGD
jgi:hypothetical protein